MIYLLYSALLGSAVIFVNLSHPVGLGLTLILHTLLISCVTGLVGGTFWFSYILFLVFLGGVLVLFIYMTSLASNEKFVLNWESLMAGTLAIGAVGVGGLLYFCPGPEVEGALPDWPVGHLGFVGLKVAVMKLYSVECFSVTVLLILYLLYALLVCAHVVSKYSGALRNFN